MSSAGTNVVAVPATISGIPPTDVAMIGTRPAAASSPARRAPSSTSRRTWTSTCPRRAEEPSCASRGPAGCAASPEALLRRVAAIEASGYKIHGWTDGDLSHGRAFRFEDPFGHIFEIYYDTNRPPAGDEAALKNMASKFHAQGACPRRIDHVNLLAEDVSEFRRFMETCLGSRVTEMIQLDNGRIGGCWFTVNNKTYDLACTEEHGRGQGRLHHVTYATDQREDILRAADIFLENGVHIETGPHKHAIQGTFFLYVWEPAGNRVELANAGARLILAPDWQPVVWTEAERKKGQAWGLKTIETFHTHGTPPVRKT